MRKEVDVLVIGAGQAGLAMGYYLEKEQLSYAIVDAGERIGDTWRNRYESLVLFTPRGYSSLPGMEFPGDQDSVPTKNEVADYMEAYATTFSFPIQLQTVINKLERTEEGFRAITNRGEYVSKQVIVATGPFQKPFIPRIAGTLSEEVFQIHSAAYRAPSDLADGSVLVVGGGNTGVQLAIELSEDRNVYLALGEDRKSLPLQILNKSIFWWFDMLGLLEVSIQSRVGKWLSKQRDPIFGLGPQLKSLVEQGKIKLMPKLSGLEGNEVIFNHGEKIAVQNILWSTGFTRDYSWINIPELFQDNGNIDQQRGVTPIPGLYFLGLPWQYRRGSALIGGVGRDASYLISKIVDVKNNNTILDKTSPAKILDRIYKG